MRILVLVISFLLLGAQAWADQRYALLIGNEDYPVTVGPLNNPHEDVARIKDALLTAGFPEQNIAVVQDATQSEMNLAIAKFSTQLRNAGDEGIGFFYYSGHGGSAEASGTRANYLIPAKTPITGSENLPILGVSMNGLINSLSSANAKAVFVVSDACRNTLPFTSTKGGQTDKGMVRVQKRSGMYIAYATADGATAPDDGAFSMALAKQLQQSGLTADRAFTLAFREVSARRPGNALPFSTDGLTEDIYFAGRDAVAPAPTPGPGPAPSKEADDLVAALVSKDISMLETFLNKYPDSNSADYVRQHMQELKRTAALAERGVVKSEPKPAPPTVSDNWQDGLTGEAVDFARFCLDGQPSLCYNLALNFDRGTKGAPQSRTHAKTLLKMACDGDFMAGCDVLGRFLKSEGDEEGARKYFTIACNQDVASSCGFLNSMTPAWAQGISGRAEGEAKYCLEGQMELCYNLALNYTKPGEGAEVNRAHTITLLDKACQGDLKEGCDILGRYVYDDGDRARARDAFRKGCRLGADTSCEYLKSWSFD